MLQITQNDNCLMPHKEKVEKLTRLCNQRKFDDVFKQTQILLKQFPMVYIFWNILGISASRLGNHYMAIEAFKTALTLNPSFSESYYNMGIVFKAKGKLSEAINAYEKAITLKPDYVDAHINLSNIYFHQGKLEKAKKGFEKVLILLPNSSAAYNNIGLVLSAQGKLGEAINAYEKAITLKPDYAEAYSNIGVVFSDLGKLDNAIESFKKAISLKPHNPKTYNNMGIVFHYQGKLDKAIESFNKSILYRPDYAYAFNNLAGSLKDQGKLDEAIDAYNKALLIKPNYPEAYCNSSFIYNLRGQLKKGLELYEWRLKRKTSKTRPPRDHLIWDGIKPISGKNFFVYAEQGFGDMIQFSRYLPLLKQRGAKVTFRVQPKMHVLLQTVDKDIVLVDSDPEDSEIDFEVPLMSLPHLFNTNLSTIPSSKSYLYANREKVISWGNRLKKPTFKVGICWQGSTLQSAVGRSVSLSLFEDISKLPNVELISLHKGEGEKQIRDINFNLTTFGHDFDSGENAFIDTAALMVNCDLIISCDTSIAHLAGALGCQIWVALKKIPEWRWMLDRTDSPWYPNMTLYRQKEPDNWEAVFKSMKQDLLSLIKNKKR